MSEAARNKPMSNRPVPTKLRELSGGNLHRINKREARFRKVKSAEEALPDWHDEKANEEFHRLVPDPIAQGLLDRGNIMFFAFGICATPARSVTCMKSLEAGTKELSRLGISTRRVNSGPFAR